MKFDWDRVLNPPKPEHLPLEKLKYPTEGQIRTLFLAWKNGGSEGLLEAVRNNKPTK